MYKTGEQNKTKQNNILTSSYVLKSQWKEEEFFGLSQNLSQDVFIQGNRNTNSNSVFQALNEDSHPCTK